MSETIWAGRILRVDLTRREISEQPRLDYIPLTIGGRGIGQWILFRELDPNTGPYDPENILSFNTGALAGTLAPCSGRISVDTKNPFTGGVCSSNAGAISHPSSSTPVTIRSS